MGRLRKIQELLNQEKLWILETGDRSNLTVKPKLYLHTSHFQTPKYSLMDYIINLSPSKTKMTTKFNIMTYASGGFSSGSKSRAHETTIMKLSRAHWAQMVEGASHLTFRMTWREPLGGVSWAPNVTQRDKLNIRHHIPTHTNRCTKFNKIHTVSSISIPAN